MASSDRCPPCSGPGRCSGAPPTSDSTGPMWRVRWTRSARSSMSCARRRRSKPARPSSAICCSRWSTSRASWASIRKTLSGVRRGDSKHAFAPWRGRCEQTAARWQTWKSRNSTAIGKWPSARRSRATRSARLATGLGAAYNRSVSGRLDHATNPDHILSTSEPKASRAKVHLAAPDRVIWLVVAAIVLWGGWAFGSELMLNLRLTQEVQQLRDGNAQLAASNGQTRKEVSVAASPAAMEEAARRAGFARPGEQVYVIVKPTSSAGAAADGESAVPSQAGAAPPHGGAGNGRGAI